MMKIKSTISGWNCQRWDRQNGFTLIELMITVAIIAILTAIAYPSYQEYVRKGNRAEARSILLETAQVLERNYTTANRYDQDSAGNVIALPFATSPKSGTVKYNIALSTTSRISGACAIPGQCFMLTATPTGVMAGDNCGNLRLDDSGVRDATGAFGTATCWER